MWNRVVCNEFTNVVCDMWNVKTDRTYSYVLVLNFPYLFYVLLFTLFYQFNTRVYSDQRRQAPKSHAVTFIRQQAEETFRLSCSFTCCKNIALSEVAFFWRFFTVQHIRTYNWVLLTFKRRIKSRLPFAGIIRSSPYSPS